MRPQIRTRNGIGYIDLEEWRNSMGFMQDKVYVMDDDQYVDNSKSMKSKRPQDGGLAKWKERKWPVADNGLPVLEPGYYWLVDKVFATLSKGYAGDTVEEVSRLCLMNSNETERYGTLNLRKRDKRESSIRLIEREVSSGGGGSRQVVVALTPSNLLKFADKLMDHMEKRRAEEKRKAAEDELRGDYRHKVLEIGELE